MPTKYRGEQMYKWIRYVPCHVVGINGMIGTLIKKETSQRILELDLEEWLGTNQTKLIHIYYQLLSFWSQGIELGMNTLFKEHQIWKGERCNFPVLSLTFIDILSLGKSLFLCHPVIQHFFWMWIQHIQKKYSWLGGWSKQHILKMSFQGIFWAI